jgi:hypothetical protein
MKTFFATAFCLLLYINSEAQTGNGLLIRPYVLEYKLDRGQSASQKITILNRMDQKAQFRLYINDWLRDSMGGHVYQAVNTLPHSCSRWISFENEFVEVNPGETKELVINLNVPDSAEAVNEMRWSMLFIETISEAKAPVVSPGGVSTQIDNKMRLGIHIYQTPPAVIRKEMKLVSFDETALNSSVYRLVCVNTGSIQLRCNSTLEIIDFESGTKTKLKPIESAMFPGQKRFIDFELPGKLKKGKYSLLATIDGGEDIPLEAAQKEIEIK